MVEAMSHSFLAVIPESWGPYLAVITAVASMPFTFFMSNDAFYFGVLPILSEAAGNYGITPPAGTVHLPAGGPGQGRVRRPPEVHPEVAIAISMLLMVGSLLFGLYPLAA
ncbi:hypothetical protein G6F31_014456 [Rhizopus arrhizus]|nr:hypothetical protein G6F31_014456 [Rhizopus arrhizus]